MAMTQRMETKDGRTWAVCNGIVDDPAVVIPISQIEGMTTEEIGRGVLSLIIEARKCRAYEVICDWDPTIWNPPGHLEWLKSILEPLKNEDPAFFRVLSQIAEIENCQKARERRKQTVNPQRADIVKRYNKLFVKIGRRDGFKCAWCDSTGKDLQIDHKIPISRGGSNKLDNLQLLCAACNRSKSDIMPEPEDES